MKNFTKQIIISAIILLISSIAEAQNVGIGTTNPQTKLQVAGALGFVADSAAAADADTIPDNVSVFRIIYTSGGSRTGLIVLHPKEGQLLTIYDEDDNDAIFAGQIIPANGGIAYFIYLDGAWQLVSTNPITGPTGATGAAGTNGTNGTDGVTGATGPVGPAGANGSNGNNGATGPTGPAVATGAAGTNGATWITGTVAPTGGQGNVNDLYLNTATSEYYLKTGASTWTDEGNLTGATGAAGAAGAMGATGAAGATGATGSVWITGTVAPTGGQGNINDMYLNTAAGQYYQKTGASTWTSEGNLTGATGAAGAVGTTGVTGTNGTTGATGATGLTGPLITGATGQTLYNDGTTWTATSNLYNDGTNVSIGTAATANAKLEVGGNNQTIRVDGLTSTTANQFATAGTQLLYTDNNGDLTVTKPASTPSNDIDWSLFGNTGTTPGTNFIGTGTGNNAALVFKTSGTERGRFASYGDFVIGSGDSSSTVSGGILRAPSVWGGAGGASNTVGADLTVTAGDGTGTSGSGSVIFKTAPAGSTGSTVNSMAERMRVTNTGALAFGGATSYGTGGTGVGSILVSSGNATPAWSTATYPSGTTTAIPINTLLYASASNVISPLAAATTTGMILTNSSGTPTWTTATYPATTTINQILFSSAANVVTGITAGTTNQVLTSNSSGVPGWSSTLSVPAAASVGTVLTVGNRVSAKAFNGNTRQIVASDASSVQLDSTDFFVFVTFVSGDATNNTITLPNPAADYVGHLIIIRQSKNSSGKVKIASFSGSQISQLSDNDDTNLVSSLTDSDNRGSDMFILGNSASGGLVWYEIGQSNTPW